jgi:hypothetical protein
MRNKIIFGCLWYLLVFTSCEQSTNSPSPSKETVYPGDPVFEQRMSSLQGVWYSYFDFDSQLGKRRSDGYRIGKKSDFDSWGQAKAEVICPYWAVGEFEGYVNSHISNSDYIILYDDTCYGMFDDSSYAADSKGLVFMGVVRAVNIFNDDPKQGAIIIEYIVGCDPQWLWDPDSCEIEQGLEMGEKPFFGIYYRELSSTVVYMANAVDLAALAAGRPYYTEKGTLTEAIAGNMAEHEAKYIAWGIVSPQEKER